MMSKLSLSLAVVAVMVPGVNLPAAPLPARVDFNYHIKPLLSDRCFACHGPDEKGRKGKLRLDTQEGAFKALDDGKFIIKPGDAAKSEVMHRLTSTDPEEMMPPPKANLALSADEIAMLKKWIEQGAEWRKHWAFIPVGNVAVPETKNRKWARNEIDRFVLAKLEAEKLKPAPEATKERLLRRVSLDLTGLPPTPAEVDAFLTDKSSNAYEKVVDRLLASPAYGERMAVEWLDVARYADTYGYQADRINHLWPWRDRVIKSFNRNIRINQFIIEQLAGDLLPDATQDQKVATAFNRLHRQTNEGGSVDEEFRVEYNADRVHTARRRVPRPHDGMRALSRPQIRSRFAEGLLPPVRVLQLHRRIRPILALHRRHPDADHAALQGRRRAETPRAEARGCREGEGTGDVSRFCQAGV